MEIASGCLSVENACTDFTHFPHIRHLKFLWTQNLKFRLIQSNYHHTRSAVLSELIPLSFDKIMQTRAYTVIILSARDKRFAIYTEPVIGRNLQLYLTNTEKQRPLTHDLINNIMIGFNARVRQVVINDVQDTIYYARLYLECQMNDLLHIIEIDARPSDCITLALMSDAPVYCTHEVLDRTVAIND